MQPFLVVFISLIFTIILIRYLHKSQQKKAIERADLSSPLPPLSQESESLDEHLESLKVGIAPAVTSPIRERHSWQDEVSNLRGKGLFQEALSLCRRQYPKMLAHQLTLFNLGAHIKNEKNVSGETLKTLYNTAILADLVKTIDSATIEEITLKLEQTDNPEIYWQNLGYRNLELLTSDDCKLLIKHWGEPDTHGNVQSLLDNHP